jgi:hypothetical protein
MLENDFSHFWQKLSGGGPESSCGCLGKQQKSILMNDDEQRA